MSNSYVFNIKEQPIIINEKEYEFSDLRCEIDKYCKDNDLDLTIVKGNDLSEVKFICDEEVMLYIKLIFDGIDKHIKK